VIVIASPSKQIKNKIIWRIERLTYFLNDDAAFTFYFNIWQCRLSQNIGLTSSIEILRDITNGIGPAHSIISLGCAGWYACQLESELAANVWLSMPATSDLVFRDRTHDIWKDAYGMLGVDPAHCVSDTGQA